MLRLRRVSHNYRELFVARYDQLLGWALQLTQGDRGLAEDLLHDVYVLLSIHEAEINPTQNVDGYLYTCLRNLWVSHVRRTMRIRFQQLSIIDYESAKTGLRTIDPRIQIEVQDDLRRICQFACVRKDSSRTGSVLILRFFHGYYPSEIVQVLRASRSSVDARLHKARAEARAYLEDPQSLSFIASSERAPEIFPTNFVRTTADLLSELRQMIFASRPGVCIPRSHLQNFYRPSKADSMECAELAHLVSCTLCLDEVNRMLKLPALSQRYLTDTTGKDRGSHGGDSGGGIPGDGPEAPHSLTKRRKHNRQIESGLNEWDGDAREAFEHKPQELCVAVNGYLLTSQKIVLDQNELTLRWNTKEKPSFIEVFSEQGIRLSLLSVGDPPPEGTGEQRSQVKLSDSRSLALTLHFTSPFPTLHVTYNDPALASMAEVLVPDDEVEDYVKTSEDEYRQQGATQEHPITRLMNGVRHRWSDIDGLLLRWRWGSDLLLRPAVVTALVALVLATSLLLYFRSPTPVVTAVELLNRSVMAEVASAAQRDVVLHRTISLDEKNDRGELISRRKIEIWHSADRELTARRLYNEQGQLVAGDWRRADGVQTLYSHGKQPQLKIGNRQSAINNFDDVWQLSPSAKDFAALVKDPAATRVQELGDRYVIRYESSADTRAISENPNSNKLGNRSATVTEPAMIISATIVLSKNDVHATEQSLIIRKGNEVRQYRFVETAFERRAPSGVESTVFEPEPELPGDAATRRHGDAENIAASPHLPVPASVATVASAALEVEVLQLIQQTGADLGDEVTVRRSVDGRLQVQGIVETEARKNEIVQALTAVAQNPALQIRIHTLAEELKQQAGSQASSSPTTIERFESGVDSKMPVDAELRRYFSSKGLAGAELDQRINDFAEQVGSRSLRVLRHAGALQRLAQRFSIEQLQMLDPEARSRWQQMLSVHAQALQRELSGLRRELGPFADFSSLGTSQELSKIGTDRELQQSSTRLFELCSANDQALRSAFTVSPNSSNAAAIRSPQFWNSFRTAESLAARIARSQ